MFWFYLSLIFCTSLAQVVTSGSFALSLTGGTTSTTLVDNAVSTPLIFSNEYVNLNFGNISLPTSTILIPQEGFYDVKYSVYFLAPSASNTEVSDNRSLIFYVNGEEFSQETVAAVNADQTRISSSVSVYLYVNDSLSVNVYQASGESLYVNTGLISVTLTAW